MHKYYDPQQLRNAVPMQLMILPPPPLTNQNSLGSSASSTWTYKGGFSELERGERIKPDRNNKRNNVQKMNWRSSRWVQGYGDGDGASTLKMQSIDYQQIDSRISSMTIADVSPRVAVKRIILLYENYQYREAANFINRLSHGTFKVILHELPIDLFIESMPHSLSILEALYAKVFLSEGLDFGMKLLRPEGVVMQMVKFFSNQDEGFLLGGGTVSHAPKRNALTGAFLTSCKKLLKVIVLSDPKIRKVLHQRRRALDKATEGLGQHGLVGTTDQNLMNLHDALRLEFQRVVETYKEALQKLEELSLASNKRGSAPIQASHQRQLALRQSEIQERLIKNKTLLNVVEPTLGNHSLDILLGILQRRIECDKDALFQFTQLRKETNSVDPGAVVAPVLMRFSQGCEQVLELMRDVADDDGDSSDISGYHSDSDSAIMMSGNSPFISKRARYNFLTRSVRSGSKASSARASILQLACAHSSSGSEDHAPTCKGPPHGATTGQRGPPNCLGTSAAPCGTTNASPTRPRHIKHKKELQKLNSAASSTASSTAGCVSCERRASLQVQPPSNERDMAVLQAQLEQTRSELTRVKTALGHAHEHQKLLQERLHSEQTQRVNRASVDSSASGSSLHAAASLVHGYGNLYAQARVDTLDALDNLPELKGAEELKSKILFSVVVLAFRSVQALLTHKKECVRKILQMPECPTTNVVDKTESAGPAADMEKSLIAYFKNSADKFDLTNCVEDVCQQIWATLYDYPCLKSCQGLISYVKSSVKLAWSLINQTPPFVLEYELRTYRRDLHVRFHASNPESDHIRTYLWPALLEGNQGPCVSKGVVMT